MGEESRRQDADDGEGRSIEKSGNWNVVPGSDFCIASSAEYICAYVGISLGACLLRAIIADGKSWYGRQGFVEV